MTFYHFRKAFSFKRKISCVATIYISSFSQQRSGAPLSLISSALTRQEPEYSLTDLYKIKGIHRNNKKLYLPKHLCIRLYQIYSHEDFSAAF